METRRLILFAGYSSDGDIGPALLHQLRSWAAAGRVVAVFDSPLSEASRCTLEATVSHVEAGHHGQYDFGSFKRGFASERANLHQYDYVYLVNDSVFGPLGSLEDCLRRIEALQGGAVALASTTHHGVQYMQSWLIGLRPQVFLDQRFAAFLDGVQALSCKEEVCIRYENGLSDLLRECDIPFSSLYVLKGKSVYNDVLRLYRKGLPFVKKSAFVRHNGCLGMRLRTLLSEVPAPTAEAIKEECRSNMGDQALQRLLCGGPLAMAGRYIAYLWGKVASSPKVGRIALNISLLTKGHVLVPLWWNSSRRRAARYKAYGTLIPEFFKKYYIYAARAAALSAPQQSDTPPEGTAKADGAVNQDTPEKVFSLWLQGEDNAPQIVKSCLASIRAGFKGCDVKVLDEGSLKEYTLLPQWVWDKWKAGKISNAQFSDICRLDLLYRYGGYWIDSTCMVTSPVPDYVTSSPFFAFMAGSTLRCNYSFIQSCFLHARPSSVIIRATRAMILEFWRRENSKVDYLQMHLMLKAVVQAIPKAAEEFALMPQVDQDPTHHMWFTRPDDRFDKAIWEEIRSRAFFQKTTYRAAEVRRGSNREFIMKFSADENI